MTGTRSVAIRALARRNASFSQPAWWWPADTGIPTSRIKCRPPDSAARAAWRCGANSPNSWHRFGMTSKTQSFIEVVTRSRSAISAATHCLQKCRSAAARPGTPEDRTTGIRHRTSSIVDHRGREQVSGASLAAAKANALPGGARDDEFARILTSDAALAARRIRRKPRRRSQFR